LAFLLLASAPVWATPCNIDGGNGCCVRNSLGNYVQYGTQGTPFCEVSGDSNQHSVSPDGQIEYACDFAGLPNQCPINGCVWHEDHCYYYTEVPSPHYCYKDVDEDLYPNATIKYMSRESIYTSCNVNCNVLSAASCIPYTSQGGAGIDYCLLSGAPKCLHTSVNAEDYRCSNSNINTEAKCDLTSVAGADCVWMNSQCRFSNYEEGNLLYSCEFLSQAQCSQLPGCQWFTGSNCVVNPGKSDYVPQAGLQACAQGQFDCKDNDATVFPCNPSCSNTKDIDCDGQIDACLCANGVLDPGEQCDNVGGQFPPNCNTQTCLCMPGYIPGQTPNTCVPASGCPNSVFDSTHSFLEVRNKYNQIILRVDQEGNLFLRGGLYTAWSAYSNPDGVGDFIINGPDGQAKAWVSGRTGDMWLLPGRVAGLHEYTSSAPTANGNLVIQNKTGSSVTWFDDAGNLYLKGCLGEGKTFTSGGGSGPGLGGGDNTSQGQS
jgi:hypothetical protein